MTDQPPIEHCRSCGAPIRWCRHINTGRPAPIDADPAEDGNVSIYGSAYTVVVRATTADPGPFYHNHFVTCPHAAQHAR
jgi:hypothetical protein